MTNHVLIASGTSTQNGERVYHEPHPDDPDVPKCRQHRIAAGSNWAKKDPDMLPYHRVCKDCTGEIDRGNKGPELSAVLEKMDPDDLGGGVA